MQAITVRALAPSDEPDIGEVDRLATAELRKVYRPTAAAHARRSAIDSELRRLVAVIDGRPVGTVQYRHDSNRLKLLGLGVHPNFRRQGVATALMQALEQIASVAGNKSIQLHTIRESGNVTIFERMGFAIESQSPTNLFESDHHSILHEVAMTKNFD